MIQIKRCPFCFRSYSDISLSFCLSDGSLLSAPHDSKTNQIVSLEDNEPETTISQNKSLQKQSKVQLKHKALYFGDSFSSHNFSLSLQRTLRLPDDGKVYPLPASLGKFPIYKVDDYANSVPESWNKRKGVFVPIYQREALWIEFSSSLWEPRAIKVAAGMINASTGEAWGEKLSANENDYMVCPPQKWLDGFKTSANVVSQFVAMPLGQGYTVEEQLTGKAEFGGIQIIVFEPKRGIFQKPETDIYQDGALEMAAVPQNRSPRIFDKLRDETLEMATEPFSEMGLAAGGKIEQKIYEDKHGVEIWDENNFRRVYIHLVNSEMFSKITGLEPPASPITAETYVKNEIPWFEIYDENHKDIKTSEKLYTIKPIGLIDKMKNLFSTQENKSIKINKEKITKLNLNSDVEDGEW